MPDIPLPFLINFVSAVLITILGFFVLRRDRRNSLNKLFSLMTISLAFWIFSSALSDLMKSPGDALILADLALVGPFFFVALLFFFVHGFPTPRGSLNRWIYVLVLLPPFLALPLVFTPLNIESVTAESWGTNFVPGPLYNVLGLYILIMFVASGRELFLKYKAFKDPERRSQLYFLTIAFALTVVFGTLANLVLPLLGDARLSTIGPSATVFFVLFCTYAIVKHHLLDVKVIAAELFGTIMMLVTFFQLFTASTVGDFTLKLLLFLTTSVVAALLIKSVLQEVRRRQEMQHMAAELAVSNKRLRQLDDLKTTMVSIASHQLRGPLGGMRGYLTMFRDGDLGPVTDRQREIVRMNLNVLTRLLNAIETFLDITKLESGKMLLRKETLPLDDAVRDVVDEFTVLAEKKGLKLTFEVRGERPVWVDFDPEKIKHVVFNLIDNALKYTERGSIAVTVRSEAGEAVFEVKDTGMGVPPDDVNRLFGKYERGELVVDRGGSGLGLYVVKMLTELQGGRVWASSPGVGKGATFSVSLPLAKHV
jgi:signal transduction histidine kinase